MKEIKKYIDVIRYGKSCTADVVKEGDIISITEKIDGCFHYDTLITLGDGSKEKIGKIVSNKLDVEVMTYNFKTNKLEPQRITNWFNHGRKKNFICLKYQSPIRKGGRANKIICTEDHLFWTNSGWKEARILTSDDIIYTFNEKLTNVQEQLIIGGLLGDSSIYPTIKSGITESRNRGIAYAHSDKQLDYIKFKNKLLDSYFLKSMQYISGYGSEGTKSLSICCKPIETLIKICVNKEDKKEVNENWLAMLNPIGLAFWYMDDGSLSKGSNNQKERATFHTEGFSEKEVDLLINMLDLKYNIKASKIYYRDKYFKIDLDTRSSEILFDIISPYIIKSMQYKLPKLYEMEFNFWNYYKNNITENGLYSIKIIEKTNVPNYINNFNNYDIEVENNHNYFAGGILVHNSNASFRLDKTNPLGVSCYSRNQILSEEQRLSGFYDWVKDNIVPIKDKLIPNYIYYGEYLVSHKVVYKPEYYKNFYAFSIWDTTTEQYLSDDIVIKEARKLNIKTTNYFYQGEYISFEHLMSFVGKSDMTLEPNMGEGIVVKNVNYADNRNGEQCFVKLVSERFAEIQKQKVPKNPNVNNVLKSLIMTVLTKPRVEKLIYKLVDDGLLKPDYAIEDMGTILRTLGSNVYEDIIKEESELFEQYETDEVKRGVGKNIPNIVKEILKEQNRA